MIVNSMETKIFGIGLQRTGTTSLHRALQLLGYRSAPHAIALFYDIHAPILSQYDAFSDNPIPLLYPQLDEMCANGRFILTTRPLEAWLTSVEWLFRANQSTLTPQLKKAADDIHLALYNTTQFDRERFKDVWHKHHEDVQIYFQHRPNDLLCIDLSQDDNWQKLCTFLGKPIPSVSFPHQNARKPKKNQTSRLILKRVWRLITTKKTA